MKKILFVCTGGTCRSPMASAMLKEKLKKHNLQNKKISVSFAGINADINSNTNPNSIAVLKQLGYSARATKAKQLTNKMVTKNTTIITMTDAHKMLLSNLDNVKSSSQYLDGEQVPDPYGGGIDEYLQAAKIIDKLTDKVIEELQLN